MCRARGFTLLEVLTTLAFLVVVMGLMVSLARYVRAQSAQQYTRRLLAELELAHAQYASVLPPFDIAGLPIELDEKQARELAEQVNGPYVADLLKALHPGETQTVVRDAWSNPVGFLPNQNPRIGMAPQNRPFFFSAGPDGRYLTRQDNLYSYEQIEPGDLRDLPAPLNESPGMVSVDTANNEPATLPSQPPATAPARTTVR